MGLHVLDPLGGLGRGWALLPQPRTLNTVEGSGFRAQGLVSEVRVI